MQLPRGSGWIKNCRPTTPTQATLRGPRYEFLPLISAELCPRRMAKELIDWCTRPEYVYTHRWQRHDLVMWDNRCALHRATAIPAKEKRIMHRTTIAGQGPVV